MRYSKYKKSYIYAIWFSKIQLVFTRQLAPLFSPNIWLNFLLARERAEPFPRPSLCNPKSLFPQFRIRIRQFNSEQNTRTSESIKILTLRPFSKQFTPRYTYRWKKLTAGSIHVPDFAQPLHWCAPCITSSARSSHFTQGTSRKSLNFLPFQSSPKLQPRCVLRWADSTTSPRWHGRNGCY
jgi:hypothetical protein